MMGIAQGGGQFVFNNFVQPGQKELIFPIETSGNFLFYRTQAVSTNGNYQFAFGIPNDFSSLISLGLDCIPRVTNAVANIDLLSSYGNLGEPANNHLEVDIINTFPIVTNILFSLNVASVFTMLSAGDRCGLRVVHNAVGAPGIEYLQLRLRYQ